MDNILKIHTLYACALENRTISAHKFGTTHFLINWKTMTLLEFLESFPNLVGVCP
jgi:hypothetical protein